MKVVVLKRYERKFRSSLYKNVIEILSDEKIDLEIIYGEPYRTEKKNIKDYISDSSLGKKIKNIYIPIGKNFVCYQPILLHLLKADIVIVQQGNKELINFILILSRFLLRKPLVVFWGHGKNFQGNKNSYKERFKRWYSNKVDYWFAYNEHSKGILIENGFDKTKITSLNNTIDTTSEIEYFDRISGDYKKVLRTEFNISENDLVGIFCASIYPDKKIEFLLETIRRVKLEVGNFKFIMIGSGEQDYIVKEFENGNSDWFNFVGGKFGHKKIDFFSIADFQLIPGGVGLNIIDSFAFACPLFTTHAKNHGPEISYLEDGVNGIITDFNIDDYTSSVLFHAKNPEKLNLLKQNCKESRNNFSIEKMADNFVRGIKQIINEQF